ncbi:MULTISPECIES: sugar ABC transporter permease [Streptomyces]|uniref:sugar ABC transporter permease n=1 Tax=Streptomyces TaxID=1883 RepID=UPI00370439C7
MSNSDLHKPPVADDAEQEPAVAAPPPAADAIVAVDPRLLIREQGLAGYVTEFKRRLHSGDLGSMPVIVALILIWGVFQGMNSTFLSANNLSTIAFNVVGTGMIAVGIVFVLLLGEIDLSVSYVSGLAGAVFAVLSVYHGFPEPLALVLGILTGTAIGALQGFFFAKVGVPAFVVTLAGFLAWNGAMLWVLGKNGTINLKANGLLYNLYNYTFTDVAYAYGLALIGVLLYLGSSLWQANRRRQAGVPFRPLTDIIVKTVLLAIVSFAAAVVLNQADGLPLCLLLFLAVVIGLDLVLRRTTYGRQIFAVGGGIEAARRAGINVAWIRISVFMLAGTMAAVGGMFLAGQVNSAQSTQGGGNTLMNAIAAAVIGGTSLFGGRGKTWSALLGALVIVSIQQGMYILNLNTAIQYMITGAVLLAAVVVDSVSRRTQKASGRA